MIELCVFFAVQKEPHPNDFLSGALGKAGMLSAKR